MTTRKFIDEIEKLGMSVEICNFEISITDPEQYTVGRLDMRNYLAMDTNFVCFNGLDTETKRKLFDLMYEYATTPIEEREIQEKYYLRLKGSKHLIGDIFYLNQNIESEKFSISNSVETETRKTKFTQEEIDRIPAELLEIFDKVKVEG